MELGVSVGNRGLSEPLLGQVAELRGRLGLQSRDSGAGNR